MQEGYGQSDLTDNEGEGGYNVGYSMFDVEGCVVQNPEEVMSYSLPQELKLQPYKRD
jgi:hypothetical protein